MQTQTNENTRKPFSDTFYLENSGADRQFATWHKIMEAITNECTWKQKGEKRAKNMELRRPNQLWPHQSTASNWIKLEFCPFMKTRKDIEKDTKSSLFIRESQTLSDNTHGSEDQTSDGIMIKTLKKAFVLDRMQLLREVLWCLTRYRTRIQKGAKRGFWGFESKVVTVESTVLFEGFMESLIWCWSYNEETKPRARLQKRFWFQFGKGN